MSSILLVEEILDVNANHTVRRRFIRRILWQYAFPSLLP